MKIEHASKQQPAPEQSNENSHKAITARPYYLQNCINTPQLYWTHNLYSNKSPDLQNNFGSDPEIVKTALIQSVNVDGDGEFSTQNFLDINYKRYCDTLMANESEQPFFEYLVSLARDRQDEFKRSPYKKLCQWINSHDDYIVSPPLENEHAEKDQGQPKLTLRQIALVLYRNGSAVDGKEAKELMKKNEQSLVVKMHTHFNEYHTNRGIDLLALSEKKQSEWHKKNLLAAFPYLDEKAKEEAGKELLKAFPGIKLPV